MLCNRQSNMYRSGVRVPRPKSDPDRLSHFRRRGVYPAFTDSLVHPMSLICDTSSVLTVLISSGIITGRSLAAIPRPTMDLSI